LSRHPRKLQLEFISLLERKAKIYCSVMKYTGDKEEQNKFGEDFKNWKILMLREPLYRNQCEYTELMIASYKAGIIIVNGFNKMIKDERKGKYLGVFNKLYGNPALFKAYKINPANKVEMEKWRNFMERKKNPQRKVTWTLGAPDEPNEFWKWFDDEKTGRPVDISEIQTQLVEEEAEKNSQELSKGQKTVAKVSEGGRS